MLAPLPEQRKRCDYNASMENAERYRILVVDDEVAIANLVKSIFEAESMEVTACYRPEEALEAARTSSFDLAIMDVMMPGMDGFELCRLLQAQQATLPVIFLTAKDEETDIVVGFALGAEDYVTKPFKPRELVARVKARLRRRDAATASIPPETLLRAQGIELDAQAHEVTLHDIPLMLTPKEFSILEQLLRQAGQPIAAKDLYETAWGEAADASSANTIMVHIRHLRQKLAALDSSRQFIETAWGVGYRIMRG